MPKQFKPPVIDPLGVAEISSTGYPSPYKEQVAGRSKRKLGDAVGLTQFGVNLTTLKPGSCSSMRHWHESEDEFVYVLTGELVLITDAGEQKLGPGAACGFPAGKRDGHHLINRSKSPATYLEIGTRTKSDDVTYPDVDLKAVNDGKGWKYLRKNGTPY